MALNAYLGIDIGGTKIAIGIVDSDGRVHDFQTMPTDVELGYVHALSRIISLSSSMLADFSSKGRVLAAGVGSPGPVDQLRGVILNPANLPTWKNAAIVRDIAQSLGLPTLLENDADAAALAENWIGAGRGLVNMVYITVSTGIGSGVILDGRLYRGTYGVAGEIGHSIVKPNGRRCTCGSNGCLEAMTSGWAMVRRAYELKRNYEVDGWPYLFAEYSQIAGALEDNREPDGALCEKQATPSFDFPSFGKLEASVKDGELSRLLAANESISGKEIGDAALKRDAFALFLVAESAYYLGLGLVNLVSLLDPQAIVLGGGLMHLWDVYAPVVRATMRRYLKQVPYDRALVLKAKLGKEIGVIGAARAAMIGFS